MGGYAQPVHDWAESAEDQVHRAELRRALATALESLPDLDRTIVWLKDVARLSHGEISAVTDSTVPAVRTRLHRARLRLRERRALSDQLGYPFDQIPHDYGEYLHFLKDKGVKLYINKTMTVLYNIDGERIGPALQPVSLKDMVDLFQSADRYLVY